MSDMISVFDIDFIARFAVNAVSLLVLLRFIYYRNVSQSEALSGLMLFGNGVFLVTALLHSVEISMGFAFGLFAVFSMLRYRTEALSLRDMTFLFVSIVISLMSAVSALPVVELLVVNTLVCLTSVLCEGALLQKKATVKNILYEKIELITPEKRSELLADLEARIGFKIERIDIGDIDFLKDTAQIKVYYMLDNAVQQAQPLEQKHAQTPTQEPNEKSGIKPLGNTI